MLTSVFPVSTGLMNLLEYKAQSHVKKNYLATAAKSMMTTYLHHFPPGSLALPQSNSYSIFRFRTQNTVAK